MEYAFLLYLDPSAAQESWKLTDQFVLAEADAVLPHRAQSTRYKKQKLLE